MKHFTLAASLLAAITIAPAANAQVSQLIEDIEVTSTLDTVSQYVFRGVSLGGNSVQPGTELTLGNFTAGSWYSAGFGEDSAVQADELDLYVGYQLPLEGPLQLGVVGTYYHYPQSGDLFDTDGGSAGSYEIGATAGLSDVLLSPSVSAYYDLTLENFTIEGNLSHSFDLPRDGWSLDAGLNVGHVELDETVQITTLDKAFDNYQYGTASLAANKVITDNINFYVSGNFTVNTEDDTLDFDLDAASTDFRDSSSVFWVGTGLSVGF